MVIRKSSNLLLLTRCLRSIEVRNSPVLAVSPSLDKTYKHQGGQLVPIDSPLQRVDDLVAIGSRSVSENINYLASRVTGTSLLSATPGFLGSIHPTAVLTVAEFCKSPERASTNSIADLLQLLVDLRIPSTDIVESATAAISRRVTGLTKSEAVQLASTSRQLVSVCDDADILDACRKLFSILAGPLEKHAKRMSLEDIDEVMRSLESLGMVLRTSNLLSAISKLNILEAVGANIKKEPDTTGHLANVLEIFRSASSTFASLQGVPESADASKRLQLMCKMASRRLLTGLDRGDCGLGVDWVAKVAHSLMTVASYGLALIDSSDSEAWTSGFNEWMAEKVLDPAGRAESADFSVSSICLVLEAFASIRDPEEGNSLASLGRLIASKLRNIFELSVRDDQNSGRCSKYVDLLSSLSDSVVSRSILSTQDLMETIVLGTSDDMRRIMTAGDFAALSVDRLLGIAISTHDYVSFMQGKQPTMEWTDQQFGPVTILCTTLCEAVTHLLKRERLTISLEEIATMGKLTARVGSLLGILSDHEAPGRELVAGLEKCRAIHAKSKRLLGGVFRLSIDQGRFQLDDSSGLALQSLKESGLMSESSLDKSHLVLLENRLPGITSESVHVNKHGILSIPDGSWASSQKGLGCSEKAPAVWIPGELGDFVSVFDPTNCGTRTSELKKPSRAERKYGMSLEDAIKVEQSETPHSRQFISRLREKQSAKRKDVTRGGGRASF